jgi:hypothetical protein
MKSHLHPWHLLRLILAGWTNRKQREAVECLLTENQILRDKLGRKMLEQFATIVTAAVFASGSLSRHSADNGTPQAFRSFPTYRSARSRLRQ